MSNSIVIEAGQTARRYWKDLWLYRELFYVMAWRDVKVRYKQTEIGVAWSILRPLLATLVLTIVFGHLAKLPSQGTPYVVFVLVALLPWQFFANALTESSNSVINNSSMISKVYFPRVIVPVSAVIASFMDFMIALAILACFLLWYRIVPDWRLLALPVFALMTVVVAMGVGLWFAALNVKYRDFRYVVPFIVQFGTYLSPIGFDSAIVPNEWRLLYSINPLVGIVDGFRWSILGSSIYWPGVAMSAFWSVLLLVGGVRYFRKTERTFADVI